MFHHFGLNAHNDFQTISFSDENYLSNDLDLSPFQIYRLIND
jgi:hypothetical protein